MTKWGGDCFAPAFILRQSLLKVHREVFSHRGNSRIALTSYATMDPNTNLTMLEQNMGNYESISIGSQISLSSYAQSG
jgi:hypothetical protein